MSDKPEPLRDEDFENVAPSHKVDNCGCGHDHDHEEHDDSDAHDNCGCGHDHEHSHHAPQTVVETEAPLELPDGRLDLTPKTPGKVIKKIIKEGSGACPKRGCTVRVHYTGTLLDGTQFDSSRGRDQFEFKLGLGQVIKGWDVGVASMKVGEVADFTIASDYAYGVSGSPPTIPPNATLNFNVELFSFFKEPETPEEKVEFANQRKINGNALVATGEWAKAQSEYERAISMIRYIYCPTAEMRTERDSLFKSLNLNKALTDLKTNNFSSCILSCNEVLKTESTNAKALFRRACAYRGLGEFDKAMTDLNEAVTHAPEDKSIKLEIAKTRELQKKQAEKEKKAFANMFEKMKAMSEEEAKAKAKKEQEEKERIALEEQKKKELEKKKLGEEEEKKKEEGEETKKEESAEPEIQKEKTE